jgi:hypothetical protein
MGPVWRGVSVDGPLAVSTYCASTASGYVAMAANVPRSARSLIWSPSGRALRSVATFAQQHWKLRVSV